MINNTTIDFTRSKHNLSSVIVRFFLAKSVTSCGGITPDWDLQKQYFADPDTNPDIVSGLETQKSDLDQSRHKFRNCFRVSMPNSCDFGLLAHLPGHCVRIAGKKDADSGYPDIALGLGQQPTIFPTPAKWSPSYFPSH
jgi:hypothetical protein